MQISATRMVPAANKRETLFWPLSTTSTIMRVMMYRPTMRPMSGIKVLLSYWRTSFKLGDLHCAANADDPRDDLHMSRFVSRNVDVRIARFISIV